ncbi:MAG: hypothetical protein QMC52_07630 [Candidatus Poseidoniaceae archaeon]
MLTPLAVIAILETGNVPLSAHWRWSVSPEYQYGLELPDVYMLPRLVGLSPSENSQISLSGVMYEPVLVTLAWMKFPSVAVKVADDVGVCP